MDTTKILVDLKKRPGFTENVGMVLVHNGVVRGWARADHAPVKSMKVSHDRAKMDAICREMISVNTPVYVAGFERGVLPIGLWSMAITLSRFSIPLISLCLPGIVFARLRSRARAL